MSAERHIVHVKVVVHFPPDGRTDAHRHKIVWKDGGEAREDNRGLFDYRWGDGTWVTAQPEEQQICAEIVKESEKKRHQFWAFKRKY